MRFLYHDSANNIVRKLINAKITAEELVNLYLARTEQVNPKINAVVAQNPKKAIENARKADQQLAKGKILGPLHGLPITIKDLCEVKGYPCTYGTLGKKHHIASYTATAVEKLEQAGAIIIGLTNSPELATAFESDNMVYGKTNNPYNLNKSAGGSSGGEAAIIASGGSVMGLGSDGAGSIRVPSHFCGISGIKPTRGLISTHGIELPLMGMGLLLPFGTFGPMARYVDDLYLSLMIMADYDFKDINSVPARLGNLNEVEVSSLRIGYYFDNGISEVDSEIKSAVESSVKLLASRGAKTTLVQPPNIQQSFELLWHNFFELGDAGQSLRHQMQMVEAPEVSAMRQRFMDDAKSLQYDTDRMLQEMRKIAIFRREFHNFMQNYDVLICPPAATTAKDHGESFNQLKDFSYTMPYNLLGWPAGVVPICQSSEELPIGTQVIARPFQDHIALKVMKTLEQHFEGYIPPTL